MPQNSHPVIRGSDGTVPAITARAWRNVSGLYSTARWAHPQYGRRARQLRKEPLCRKCSTIGRVVEATVADHIVPHKDDPHLFWHGELQSLCAQCHNSDKQAEEIHGYTMDLDADGAPLDPRHPFNRG